MNSDSPSIRAATLEDLNVLAVLNGVVQALHVANRPDVFRPTEHDAVLDWFRACLGRPNITVWIADLAGVPAGYLVTVLHERQEAVFSRAGRAGGN